MSRYEEKKDDLTADLDADDVEDSRPLSFTPPKGASQ